METFREDIEVESQTQTKCKICLKQRSRYTCPRCNIPYCSATCYKCVAHAQCSEEFYRDCFMEGMKDLKSSEDKEKVMEMLKRVSGQQDPLDSDDDENDDEADLAERIQDLDLDKDTNEIWSRLSEKERMEFKSMMQDGRLGELVSPWKPWWLQKQEKRPLVEEMRDNDTETSKNTTASDITAVTSENASAGDITAVTSDNASAGDITAVTSENTSAGDITAVPPCLIEIPDITVLLKTKKPSRDLRYSIINIIYGYVYISRLYNGEHRQHPEQCAQELLNLCPSLGVTTYSSVSEAIDGCMQCLANQAKSLFVSLEFSVGAVEDTCKIIHGPGPNSKIINGSGQANSLFYISAILSDLHRLCTDALKVISQARKDKSRIKAQKDDKESCDYTLPSGVNLKQLKHQCFGVKKKLEFMLSWLQQYGEEVINLEGMTQIVFCEMSSRLAEHKDTAEKLSQLKDHIPRNTMKPLIQEVAPPGE